MGHVERVGEVVHAHLTLGDQGATYADANTRCSVPAEKVTPVDTTAAGDTFIGFWLAEFSKHGDIA